MGFEALQDIFADWAESAITSAWFIRSKLPSSRQTANQR